MRMQLASTLAPPHPTAGTPALPLAATVLPPPRTCHLRRCLVPRHVRGKQLGQEGVGLAQQVGVRGLCVLLLRLRHATAGPAAAREGVWGGGGRAVGAPSPKPAAGCTHAAGRPRLRGPQQAHAWLLQHAQRPEDTSVQSQRLLSTPSTPGSLPTAPTLLPAVLWSAAA